MSYADAIFKVKRGFVIIGLTGYYNSGFKYVHAILTDRNKPELPKYGSLMKEKRSHLNERLYKKIEKTWSDIPWTPFVDIDLSKIIFIFVVDAAANGRCPSDSIIKKISEKILPSFGESTNQIKLLTNDPFDHSLTTYNDIISLYEKAEQNFDSFSALFEDKHEYIVKMQQYGSALRKFGCIGDSGGVVPSPDHLFLIPEAARRLIKAVREVKKRNHFVIKSFKNPYEVEYFKRRYSEFYLLGTLRDFSKRDIRNVEREKLEEIDENERNEKIKKTRENISDWIAHVNVKECLQKTDYFINCNLDNEIKIRTNVKFNVVKLISLIKSPGCISPNLDERGMQIAMTARQVSRCISRQVGAAVFDERGFLLGVGWNDPPSDQVPCSLRTTKELLNDPPDGVFSDFEKSTKFLDHIRNSYGNIDCPFCFREELTNLEPSKGKRSEYSRALHAEENAFFQALWNYGGKITGGTLYVTDCTCNLCAKKSYQLGIDRIRYIDEYPGISISQTIMCGTRKISIDFFEGGTGEAYFRLYTRLLQEKDLIQLYPKDNSKQ